MFLQTYTGRMNGVLRWPQLDKLWQGLDAREDWYLYEVGNDLPAEPLGRDALQQAIEQIDSFLHQEHGAEYCGVVYADNLSNPSVLKIYHPKKWVLPVAVAVQPYYPNGRSPDCHR